MAAVFAPAFPLTVGGLSPLAGRQRPITICHQKKQSRMVCTKPLQIRPRQGVHATSNRGALQLALNPLVCPDDARGGAGFPVMLWLH